MKPIWIRLHSPKDYPKVGRRVLVSVLGEGFRTVTIGIWIGKAWKLASLEKLPDEPCWPISGQVHAWRPLPEVQ